MADEEVDWGFEEQEDEWRGAGPANNDNDARVDDDVISLEGAEDAEAPRSMMSPGRKSISASTNRGQLPIGPSKNPPTGPRRNRMGADPRARLESVQGDSQSGFGSAEYPANEHQATNADVTRADSPPLPPGWAAVMSKSHKRPFYYHKESNTTVWEKPILSVEPLLDREADPFPSTPAIPLGSSRETRSTQVDQSMPSRDKRRVPAGPAADVVSAVEAETNSNVSSAYSRRNQGPVDSVPQQPGGYGRRRGRSPPPRDGLDSKRYKQDDGGRRSPPRISQGPGIAGKGQDFRRPNAPIQPFRNQSPHIPFGPSSSAVNASVGRVDSARGSFQDRQGPLGFDRPPPGSGGFGRGPEENIEKRPDNRGPIQTPHGQPQPSPVSMAPAFAKGANTAPIQNNRWGSNTPAPPSGALPNTSIANVPPSRRDIRDERGSRDIRDTRDTRDTRDSREYNSAPRYAVSTPLSAPPPSSMSAVEDSAEAKRARLREEARKAEEVLLKVKNEERRLEQEEKERQRIEMLEHQRQLDLERESKKREKLEFERNAAERDFGNRDYRGGRDRYGPRRDDDRLPVRDDRRSEPGFRGPPVDTYPSTHPNDRAPRVSMRDRLGRTHSDRDYRVREREFDRRRSPPPPGYRGPPPTGKIMGGNGGPGPRSPSPAHSRDLPPASSRGSRDYPPPPSSGWGSRQDTGFAGPPPKDLLMRLGRRMDSNSQLAEPMGGASQIKDRDDRRDRRGPRPLAERMFGPPSSASPMDRNSGPRDNDNHHEAPRDDFGGWDGGPVDSSGGRRRGRGRKINGPREGGRGFVDNRDDRGIRQDREERHAQQDIQRGDV
nr:hypothetical protein L204_04936 [Cryptococcus depauperatus CBS 7855]